MTQHLHPRPTRSTLFDARGVAKRFPPCGHLRRARQPAAGETMRFANDHDPLPLLAQIAQRYGDRVGVEYRQREPGRDRDRLQRALSRPGMSAEALPDFFAAVPAIVVADPLAALLGAAEDGRLEYHYADAVRPAGHSCPTVAGAG